MTLSDIIREIGELGCRSPRIQNDIKGWVNRAQRQLTERHNFSWMHSRQTATITSGTTSANLSARFKELAQERSPVTFTAPTATAPQPVNVKTRAELERTAAGVDGYVAGATGYYSPFFVFLEQNDGGVWTINTPTGYTHTSDATYTLSCFLFPADLALGTDTNGMTTGGSLTEALIAHTRAIAYLSEDPSDKRGLDAKMIAEGHLASAISYDTRQRMAGQRFHW